MARYSPDHKSETRERILAAAAKEFREKGVDGATIPGIMQAAGLTVGGFYKHFASKDQLFAEMFQRTLRRSTDRLNALRESLPDKWFEVFASEYLSQAHIGNLRGGCVMASLASELPRANARAGEVFQDELDYVAESMMAGLPNADRGRAMAVQALLMGGLVLARGVQDEAMAEEILAGCREAAFELAG